MMIETPGHFVQFALWTVSKGKPMRSRPDLPCGLALFGVGAGALVLGASLSAPGLGVSSLVSTAGQALGGFGSGLVANVVQTAITESWAAVSDTLRAVSRGDRLVGQHDLPRALRRTQLEAIGHVVNAFSAVSRNDEEFDQAASRQFVQHARKWISERLRELDREDFWESQDFDTGIEEADKVISSIASGVSSIEALHGLQRAAAEAALGEFSDGLSKRGGKLLDSFLPFFWGDEGGREGWLRAAYALFSERMIADERTRTLVFISRLHHIAASSDAAAANCEAALVAIASLHKDVGARLEELKTQVAEFSRLDARRSLTVKDKQDIVEAMLSTLALGSPAGHSLEPFRMAFPKGAWTWSQAQAQVRERVSKLQATFFGREEELHELDMFVEGRESGLALLAAPAGCGKSALLAKWVERRQAAGDVVARHFISTSYDQTVSPASALGHLIVQIREAEDAPIEPLPETTEALSQKLHAELSARPPSARRLIVVLDGVDEAIQPITPFVETYLSAGVYVVVSGRAERGALPPYLASWEGRITRGLTGTRLDLGGLDDADVLAWVEELVGHLILGEMQEIVSALRSATEGLPLFLSYVIEDLARKLPSAQSRSERLALISALPAPFAQYVGQELSTLEALPGSGWSAGVRVFLAVLTCAKGPITGAELEALFACARRANSAFPECPVFGALHHRISRWLSVRGAADNRQFAFAHPRLARAFAGALGERVCLEAEDALVEWAQGAWRASPTPRGLTVGAPYALDYLVRHLSDREATLRDAAALVCGPDFFLARLRDPTRCQQRFQASLDEWLALPEHSKQGLNGASRWNDFWSDNEALLVPIIAREAILGRSAADIVRQCLADAAVSGSGPALSARCLAPTPPPSRGLIRVVEDAHEETASCAAASDDRLISWGGDGAINLWSADGVLIGAQFDAHDGGVNHVSADETGIISCGEEGTIKIWTLDLSLVAEAPDTHKGMVAGVLKLARGGASWGADRAIRIWGTDGALLAERQEAHTTFVRGVYAVGDVLFSWGREGLVKRWAIDDLAPLKPWNAHVGGVVGFFPCGGTFVAWNDDSVLVLDQKGRARREITPPPSSVFEGAAPIGEGFVSWTDGGLLQIYSEAGEEIASIRKAHRLRIEGACRLGDGFASWSRDESIRTWTAGGQQLNVLVNAHGGGVFGAVPVGGHLATWGADDAVKFWSPHAKTSERDHSDVFTDRPYGLVAGPTTLASWYEDGSVSFLNEDGTLIREQIKAHPGGANGVCALGEGWVSWGSDGSLALWTSEGAPVRRMKRAHWSGVQGVSVAWDRMVSWGGNLRFWTMDGAPIKTVDPRPGVVRVRRFQGLVIASGWHGGSVWSSDGEFVTEFDLPGHEFILSDIHLVAWRKRELCFSNVLRATAALWERAHNDEIADVFAIGELIVSHDNAIARIWTKRGEPAGEFLHEDRSWINGITNAGDRLLSWSWDTLFFHGFDGANLGQTPHRGYAPLRDVCVANDRIVTLTEDGIVRILTLEGKLLEIVAPPGGASGVAYFPDRFPDRFFVLGPAIRAYPFAPPPPAAQLQHGPS